MAEIKTERLDSYLPLIAISRDLASTLDLDASALAVEVSLGGQPLAGARVSLYKAGEVSSAGDKDASGRVGLYLGSGLTAGDVAVTVTGHDLLPYRGTCTLAAAVAAQTLCAVVMAGYLSLVNAQALACWARAHDLADSLRLGRGAQTGGLAAGRVW